MQTMTASFFIIEMYAYQTYNDEMENTLLKKSAKSYAYIFLIAFHTFFGLHIVSFFTSFLNNYYRERPGISLADVGIYTALTFGAVFLRDSYC
jgi:hypothetical protein